jgi:predicted amidophosphoribosyltransferase
MGHDDKRLLRERRTIAMMIGIYCADQHGANDNSLCASCQEFQDYADRRLDKCPYGDDKPTCANCPVHCYKPEQREQVKRIMRYAGPRMLLKHPVLAIRHKFDGLRRAMHPKTLSRSQRLQNANKPPRSGR